MKNCTAILFLTFLLTATLHAQPRQQFLELYDPLFDSQALNFNVQYMLAPELESKNNTNLEFDQHVLDADIKLPIKVSERLLLILSGEYGMRFYEYSETAGSAFLEDDAEELHRISVTPSFFYFFNRNTAFMGEMTVGSYSNLDGGIKSDDLQVLGKALLIHHWRTNVQLVGGIGVTETFDNQEAHPLLGFRAFYRNWHFVLTAPLEARATYNLSDRLSLYGGIWLSGSQYAVRSDSGNDFDIQVRDTRIGAGMDLWILPDLRVSVEGGVLTGNDGFKIKSGPAVGETDGDLDDAGYVRFRLSSFLG